MKITVVNKTTAELPLTSGMPNLGRRASMEMELTSAEFDVMRPTLDVLKSKGAITYVIHADADQAPRNALVMVPPEMKQLKSGLAASNDSQAVLSARLAEVEAALMTRIELLEKKLAGAEAKVALLADVPPQTVAFRADTQNIVAQSQTSYAPVNGLELKVPSDGRWIIVGEIGLYSPVAPSKGKISLGRLGSRHADSLIEGTERTWTRTQDDTTSIVMTACLSLDAGDTISLYWKAEQGVLRATYRSVTLIRS